MPMLGLNTGLSMTHVSAGQASPEPADTAAAASQSHMNINVWVSRQPSSLKPATTFMLVPTAMGDPGRTSCVICGARLVTLTVAVAVADRAGVFPISVTVTTSA
jgi:hypothetical protein